MLPVILPLTWLLLDAKKAALGGWTGFVFKSPFDKNQKARNVLAVQAKSANAVVMTSVAVLTSPVAVSCG